MNFARLTRQAGAAQTLKLDVNPICDVTCERERSSYRGHGLLTRVTDWERRMGLYFSHLSRLLQTDMKTQLYTCMRRSHD